MTEPGKWPWMVRDHIFLFVIDLTWFFFTNKPRAVKYEKTFCWGVGGRGDILGDSIVMSVTQFCHVTSQ